MRKSVDSILKGKGGELHALGPDATVMDAVRLMNAHNIGAVLVMDPEQHLLGVFTERDVLRRVVDAHRDCDGTRLDEVMTRDVIIIRPQTTVEEALLIVNSKGCRHLPVMDGDRVAGMISIRDLTNSLVAEREHEIAELTEYISGHY